MRVNKIARATKGAIFVAFFFRVLSSRSWKFMEKEREKKKKKKRCGLASERRKKRGTFKVANVLNSVNKLWPCVELELSKTERPRHEEIRIAVLVSFL